VSFPTIVRRAATVAVAAASVTVAIVAAGPAQASTVSASAQSAHPLQKFEVKQGMYAGGFDLAVAKAHGYKIVTYSNGARQAVPVNPKSGLKKGPLVAKDTATRGALTPANSGYDEVTGDCGDSWINGSQTTTDHIDLESGFDLNSDAIAYNWSISLSDANGTSHQGGSGTLADRSTWEGQWNGLYQDDYTIDQVSTGSVAVLWDGTTCYSGGPFIVLSGLG
jgi:hypothetical protein